MEVEYFLALSIDVVVASVVLLNKRRNIASIARIPQYSESLLRVSFFPPQLNARCFEPTTPSEIEFAKLVINTKMHHIVYFFKESLRLISIAESSP